MENIAEWLGGGWKKDLVEYKTRAERGLAKHTEFFGQTEVEEHDSAVASNRVCYFCLTELEEKYGIDVALRMKFIEKV